MNTISLARALQCRAAPQCPDNLGLSYGEGYYSRYVWFARYHRRQPRSFCIASHGKWLLVVRRHTVTGEIIAPIRELSYTIEPATTTDASGG
ncbi:hypothetical protein [Sinorhizobium garamanticum]|uniref:hypothetical protein n=1 Tax=Sinorhizobium garamanticum TaxID=680247 RepID=UPI003CC8423A